jgi:hypothetical protein
MCLLPSASDQNIHMYDCIIATEKDKIEISIYSIYSAGEDIEDGRAKGKLRETSRNFN